MTERNRINVLMARKVAGEATMDELQELDRLLTQFHELQYAFTIVEDIKSLDGESGFSEAEEQQLLEDGFARISLLMQQPEEPVVKRIFPWKTVMGVAACIAVLVSVYRIWKMPQETIYRNEVVTKTGSKTSVVLPDGTSVVLNACSRLQYDASRFLKGDREVVLTGEAYFDVKHDPAHPFTIQTGRVNIRVLGTVFNVKAYTEDATVETTLLSGKVEVSFPEKAATKGNKVIILQPEQKLIIDKNDINTVIPSANKNTNHTFAIVPVKVNTADTNINDAKPATMQQTAWMNDRFEFDKLTFEQLSHDLERWYNVTVQFKNDKYKNEVFTGAFRKQRITEVLDALQIMSGFHYEVNNKENIIYIW
ncbi:FecR family protein [Chitinophaga niastensis]|uniref:FecR family protein n=1 Tax=Chitinophaga niastensis TaxID=536980 RepID=A0A2P8HM70_CHINA|nr:FecR family protein [Chitinophaga niastensis]PSL47299.1 FecR family protein [Chitinophaga niastensis]